MLDNHLQSLFMPIISVLGYELVAVERLSLGKRGLLIRVYIDSPDGIVIHDCEKVSHQINGLLDVENPITGQYTLEVSSPGVERPLFTLAHFQRYIGHKIYVRLSQPLEDNRRNFKGLLQAVEDHNLVLVVEDKTYHFLYEQVEKAHIIYE